jgi:hypothetical protein
MAVAGTGIIYLFEGWLRLHLDSGALEAVLEPWWQSVCGPFRYSPVLNSLQRTISIAAVKRSRPAGRQFHVCFRPEAPDQRDCRSSTRCCLSAFPRPDGQIARSGRPPNRQAHLAAERSRPGGWN